MSLYLYHNIKIMIFASPYHIPVYGPEWDDLVMLFIDIQNR